MSKHPAQIILMLDMAESLHLGRMHFLSGRQLMIVVLDEW
jgi:hypothetical protein